MRYGWNYAQLLSQGPSPDALVASPLMRAMQIGAVARVEELTRIPSDVQDTLITMLSEKVLPVPELNMEIQALKGFNIIATANDRDKGVNDLSSALKRRFNTVVLPLPASMEEEVRIVKMRVDKLGKSLEIPAELAPIKEIERLVTIFRELRSGKTTDGKTKVKSPSSTLSTAEAISVINSGQALAAHFGDGMLKARDLAAGIVGSIIKDPSQDGEIWKEYLETVIKERKEWADLYRAFKEI
jgi:MoxR-like ATPase